MSSILPNLSGQINHVTHLFQAATKDQSSELSVEAILSARHQGLNVACPESLVLLGKQKEHPRPRNRLGSGDQRAAAAAGKLR